MRKFGLARLAIILSATLFLTGCVGPVPRWSPDTLENSKGLEEIIPRGAPYQKEEREVSELGKPGSSLPIDAVIVYALAENPGLQAAQARWLAAKNIPARVSAYPDPQLGLIYYMEEIETKNGPMRGGVILSQRVPWFGKLGLKGKIAEKAAEMVREAYNATRLEVIAEVKVTYYELYWINKAIEITKEHRELLTQFEKVAQTKYATGKVTQQDVLKAQIELSELLDNLITLDELKETTVAWLNTLLDRAPRAPLGDPEDFEITQLKYSLESLYQLALKLRPELSAQRYAIQKSEDAYSLARLQYYPDFVPGLQYTSVDTDGGIGSDAGKDVISGMIGITLPIWRGKLKAGVQEATATLSASKDAYRNLKNLTLWGVKDLHFKIDTSKRLENLYRTSIIPQAEQSLKVSETGYRAGKVDFLDLLDSERSLLNFQLAYYRAMVDYQQRLAGLEKIVGRKLE